MLINKKIPISFIFNQSKHEMLGVLIIVLVAHYIGNKLQPNFFIPLDLPVFIGLAICIFLSFKLSKAYDKWLTALKICEEINLESKNFVVQLQSFISKEKHQQFKTIAYRHIAWCYAFAYNLRGENSTTLLSTLITQQELEQIQNQNNLPFALLQINTNEIAKLKDSNDLALAEQVQINNTLAYFYNIIQTAEQLKNKSLPLKSSLFAHIAIYIFIAFLCFAMQNIETYLKVLLSLITSAVLFLPLNLAAHLQEPLKQKEMDVNLINLPKIVDTDIRKIIVEGTNLAKPKPETFYIL